MPLFRTLAIGGISLLMVAAVTQIASAQEKIAGWHNSLETAQQQASATGKPIFAVFRCVR